MAAPKNRMLGIALPFPPMEATTARELPDGDWQFEPKWDGFRCLLFREGENVFLQSKSGQPLARYFPEVAEAATRVRPQNFLLDGEIVIPQGEALSFDDLLQRIHPAESRVRKLAASHPALLIVFDLLVDAGGEDLRSHPLAERRRALEKFFNTHLKKNAFFQLSPSTRDPKQAGLWLHSPGGALDGVMAKRPDQPYLAGDRTGMIKVKQIRSADCVVGGFRYGKKGSVVGSLLLGLYDEEGFLHHVGFTSSIRAADKPALTRKLEKLLAPPGFTGRAPGGPSRWNPQGSGEWNPLKPELVVEVAFDHFSGGRFRHGTQFLRWRPDKAPRQCRFDQVKKSGTVKGLLK